MRTTTAGAERQRLEEDRLGRQPWRRWGPYLSERQWGTVREDYSPDGNAWSYFPHEHARSRAYRWGEDGLAGVSDDGQRLCLALALWNGKDPILKERLFGLTNAEGNHGEDVKELYYYLDATPSHAYLKMLYKYPQREFPYASLVEGNRRRGRGQPEFELLDTGVFDDDRYFDVFVEYAKAAPEDLLMQVTVHNRGADAAPIHLLPQVWFRNTWSWKPGSDRPALAAEGDRAVVVRHPERGTYHVHGEGEPTLLFCDNDTNAPRLFGSNGAPGHYKDAFHEYVVHGRADAVNPARTGTKAAFHYALTVPAGGSACVRLRLTSAPAAEPFLALEEVLGRRRREADEFYAELQADLRDPDARNVQRQALAGLIWGKQYYGYDVWEWLHGDPGQPPPPPQRRQGRNRDWEHLRNGDILSMPDKWEYPWYAAWDLAFHCLPFALIDPEFAKAQLVLLTRERYLHPNGQLPAYEWAFGDVNPPVHAWAAWRVYQIDRKQRGGRGDLAFLERVFHKLLLNFTWWVNRKDLQGRNVFQGGFLGLDNIGLFDRSAPLPQGGFVNQADGTAWMAMYCLNLMRIALELAQHNPAYEDIATKFFEHFLEIAKAMTRVGGDGQGVGLWDEQDEFYYDQLHLPDGRMVRQRVRSMVGLIPLFAVETVEPELLNRLPEFRRRLEWFLDHRPDLASLVSRWQEPGRGERRLLSLLRGHRMKRLLRRMLDEAEFLSDYGVRALSRHHREHPYTVTCHGTVLTVSYQPGESDSGLFGGNSNWRGPVWFPVNYLIIEALQKFHHYYGDDFKIECPTGSGRFMTINAVAQELTRRLTRIFLRDQGGRRAVFGDSDKLQNDPHFRDYLLFYEYFHGDTGRGVGASHQTGWTGLVAKLLQPRREEVAENVGPAADRESAVA
jgi:Glycosyl hydrolase family 63 C-terminal domain